MLSSVCVFLVFQESVASEHMEEVPSSMEDLKVLSGHSVSTPICVKFFSTQPFLISIFCHPPTHSSICLFIHSYIHSSLSCVDVFV